MKILKMRMHMDNTQIPDHAHAKALRTTRYIIVFGALAAAFLAVIILNINTGSVRIPVGRILKILLLRQGEAREVSIIWKIRMPRILQAAILGGALALSGFLLQTAIVMIVLIGKFGAASSWALILAAFAGAMMSTAFILLVSRAVNHMAALLVAGIMIGYICSAVTEFLVTFAEDSDIVNLHGWSQGSFSGADWSGTGTAALLVGAAFICVFLLAKPIGAYQMGEEYAQSMGVNIKRFRRELILLSGLLSACVTAFAGPISFVGIAVPFLVKRALGTSKPLVVIPAAFMGGAVFCMVSDLIARMVFSPTELNISTVTSVLGAPVVIFMLIRRRR